QLFQGLARREPLEIELLQLGEYRMLQWQAELSTGLRSLEWPLTLQFAKDSPRAHDHLPGQAGELCDVDPVAAVGPTFDHLVQKDDALTFFTNFHPEIPQAGQSLGESGELVVMGREQR